MTTNIAWKEHHREWLNERRTLIDTINDPKKKQHNNLYNASNS